MMHNPPHPGEVLREDVIAPLGLSVTDAADRLAMSRVALSRVLNGKAGISPDLAVRLEQAGAGTAQAWVAMQANYDLWQALQHEQPPVSPWFPWRTRIRPACVIGV
ncbi:addiction module antidote protein, HigA family [Achromobacter xylosoxidans]|nr:addiction module antidote protein, HigA family [Achromobacter xylosoxidans]